MELLESSLLDIVEVTDICGRDDRVEVTRHLGSLLAWKGGLMAGRVAPIVVNIILRMNTL